jgi:hypothetical protein
MEFYKVGKVLGLTANQRLDLSPALYNHKGAFITGNGGQNVKLEFYANNTVSGGITLEAGGILSNQITNAVIPVRLAAVTANASGAQIVLLN